MKYLLATLEKLFSHKTYIIYSLAYGLSTLIVPLGIQFLVNKLALSGLWSNIIIFILLIMFGLVFSQVIKHTQLILMESLKREIFCIEIERWRHFTTKNYSHYFFEIFNLIKSFSICYSNLIEILLALVFGLTAIIFFHPLFLVVAIVILLILFSIYKSSISELSYAKKESDQKYHFYDLISSPIKLTDDDIRSFLQVRDNHFKFIRFNSFKIGAMNVIVQSILLLSGCYLITINQLSVGQLVSAEIILSGILNTLSKLPKTIETANFYEVSRLKIDHALRGHHE